MIGARRGAGLAVVLATLPTLLTEGATGRPVEPPARTAPRRACPPEMVVTPRACIDRWEISLVDARTGAALSPYYPPAPAALRRVHAVWERERWLVGSPAARRMPLPRVPPHQRAGNTRARAVSRPGVTPQGYLSYFTAREACEAAGKRLCSREEWVDACRGAARWDFPYGPRFQPGACNVHRDAHPAATLHDDASLGHLDPRLNLVLDPAGQPLLRATGATPLCASRFGDDAALDMVGNLDEWIEEPSGAFLGGFYARRTTKGCGASIDSHAPAYFDYSTGARCCRDRGAP